MFIIGCLLGNALYSRVVVIVAAGPFLQEKYHDPEKSQIFNLIILAILDIEVFPLFFGGGGTN